MLFAAGLGTRLKPFTDEHPKALAKVNDKTLLEHSIRYLQKFGIDEVVVNVHHFAEQIEAEIDYHNGYGSTITISDEREELLETGGGLKKAKEYFVREDMFVVMNVDVVTDLALDKLIREHKMSGAMATLAVMNRDSSRHLLFDEEMKLCGWRNNKTDETKTARECESTKPFAFSGLQVLSTQILEMPFEGKFSIIDVYLHYAGTHTIKGFDHSDGIFLDVGKPDALALASDLLSD